MHQYINKLKHRLQSEKMPAFRYLQLTDIPFFRKSLGIIRASFICIDKFSFLRASGNQKNIHRTSVKRPGKGTLVFLLAIASFFLVETTF